MFIIHGFGGIKKSIPLHNKKEKIIEPVICAYVHFYELKHYYVAKQTYHYLEHEIVLRSAAITSYGQDVHNKKSTIFYLYESPINSINEVSIINKHKLGWWKNEWYVMMDSTRQIHRLLGLLTSQKESLTELTISKLPATFSGVNLFYQMFEQYFPEQRLAKLSSSNIQILLNIFTSFYNFCLSNQNGKTTAQISGLSSKRLTFEEMLDSNTFKL